MATQAIAGYVTYRPDRNDLNSGSTRSRPEIRDIGRKGVGSFRIKNVQEYSNDKSQQSTDI